MYMYVMSKFAYLKFYCLYFVIVMFIRSCSLYQKIFLRALMAELSITGMEEATIRSVWRGVWLWVGLYVVQFINYFNIQ